MGDTGTEIHCNCTNSTNCQGLLNAAHHAFMGVGVQALTPPPLPPAPPWDCCRATEGHQAHQQAKAEKRLVGGTCSISAFL